MVGFLLEFIDRNWYNYNILQPTSLYVYFRPHPVPRDESEAATSSWAEQIDAEDQEAKKEMLLLYIFIRF